MADSSTNNNETTLIKPTSQSSSQTSQASNAKPAVTPAVSPSTNSNTSNNTRPQVPQSVIDGWLNASRPNFASDKSNMSWDTVTLATFMSHPAASGQADSVAQAKNGDQLPNGDLVIVPEHYVSYGFTNLALNFGVGMNVIRYYNGIPSKLPTKFDVRPGRKIVIPANDVYVPEGR